MTTEEEWNHRYRVGLEIYRAGDCHDVIIPRDRPGVVIIRHEVVPNRTWYPDKPAYFYDHEIRVV